MTSLIERKGQFESFKQVRYVPVKRSGVSYVQTHDWAREGITQVLRQLRSYPVQDQTARLMRDEIDFYLKRCHDYCIKERIGAHYREVGLSKKLCDFEHVLPKAVTRELLIYNIITVDEALNVPTCLLSKLKHRTINRIHVSSTPDIWDFWKRYRDHLADIKIETYDGQIVELSDWNLKNHYDYFAEF